jgi:hypothetical protein
VFRRRVWDNFVLNLGFIFFSCLYVLSATHTIRIDRFTPKKSHFLAHEQTLYRHLCFWLKRLSTGGVDKSKNLWISGKNLWITCGQKGQLSTGKKLSTIDPELSTGYPQVNRVIHNPIVDNLFHPAQ